MEQASLELLHVFSLARGEFGELTQHFRLHKRVFTKCILGVRSIYNPSSVAPSPGRR